VKIMKYPIQEMNLKTIPQNRVIAIGISRNQMVLCEKSIEQYGLVMPIVTVEASSGNFMVLKGENELSVLKKMNVEKADVFIANIKTPSDIGRAILLLSSLHKDLNNISEGLVLREILKSGQYNQTQLAQELMRSPSWISKRLALAEQLNEKVTEMVLSKQICPATAQIIARIPKQHQHTFAMNIYSKSIPKPVVEKLVTAYSNKKTSAILREEIINRPLLVVDLLDTVKHKKIEKLTDDASQMEGNLRILLKIIFEIETFLSTLDQNKVLKYSSLFLTVETALTRLLALMGQWDFSLGKFQNNSNGK
jgi:ParB/RepB/Spo0J family partition protein